MNSLSSITPEHVLSLVIFVGGTIGVGWVSTRYARIFERTAGGDAAATAKEAGITFVSGHFLAFFLLPFGLVVAASLAVVGKVDSGEELAIFQCAQAPPSGHGFSRAAQSSRGERL